MPIQEDRPCLIEMQEPRTGSADTKDRSADTPDQQRETSEHQELTNDLQELTSAVEARDVAYWREHLANLPCRLDLPTDRPRPKHRTGRGAALAITLPHDLSSRLKLLSQEPQATSFLLLITAFQALLARQTGQFDFGLGFQVNGRRRGDNEVLLGRYTKTLVLRQPFAPEHSFRHQLKAVREAVLEAQAHQDLPFEHLVDALAKGDRQAGSSPFIQVLFLHETVEGTVLTEPGLELGPLARQTTSAPFDLTLAVEEHPDFWRVRLIFDRDLFDRSTAERLLHQFERLLVAVTDAPDKPLGDLDLLSVGEFHQLTTEWNDSRVSYSLEPLHRRIVRRAHERPHAIALEFADGENGQAEADAQLSYGEFERRTRLLARRLQRLGVKPEVLVGLALERSLELLIGAVAILRAGGAYVPIDPSLPMERQAYLLEDALGNYGVVLTQNALRESLPLVPGIEVIALDESNDEQDDNIVGLHTGDSLDQLAYVIYTSGSTGKPKGAMNSHRGIMNRLEWKIRHFGLGPEDHFLQKTPYSFDVSVWELFTPLLLGARLVIARPDGHRDAAYLAQRIIEARISLVHFVPSMLQIFLEEPRSATVDGRLRSILCSGEALSAELHAKSLARWPRVELHNLYGPTEAAIDVTSWTCDGTDEVPIGRPVANTRLLVLDHRARLAPWGIPGQLVLGGVQVGRGYAGRPSLTAERFLPDPFSEEPGARLYTTGDLVRWRADGTLLYLGRIDFQVKIRGFRIELGEIESHLLAMRQVREAVVISSGQAEDAQLVAYVVGTAQARMDVEVLRQKLGASLPEYMVPSFFVVLDRLPLNPNGKIDRRALPAPIVAREGRRAAPQGSTERLLAAIWRELLGIEEVGRDDAFFSLGGHSLMAARVLTRIAAELGVEVELASFFAHPTLADFAAFLDQQTHAAGPPPRRLTAAERHEVGTSFAQERLWFLDQLLDRRETYNIPWPLRLHGRLDIPALTWAKNELLHRHAVLRTVFENSQGQPHPRLLDLKSVSEDALPVVDLSALEKPEEQAARLRFEDAHRPFDLATEPLLRGTLLRLEEEVHDLLLCVHHIAADGWSLDVMGRDLTRLYAAALQHENSSSVATDEEMPWQYADYTAWQRRFLSPERLDSQLGFWRRYLDGAPGLLELPSDRPRPNSPTWRGREATILLPRDAVERLEERTRRVGTTLFTGLVLALQKTLSDLSGQQDLCLGASSAGRRRLEFEDIVGFFINILVLRGQLDPQRGVAAHLDALRDSLLEVFAHQDVPFERLVEEMLPERKTSHPPLVQVVLTLQNAPASRLAFGSASAEVLPVQQTSAKFDLTLICEDSPAGLCCTLNWNRDLFDNTTGQRWLDAFVRAAQALGEGEEQRPLGDVSLLSPAQHHQLIHAWNLGEEALDAAPTLHSTFRDHAALAPDALALNAGEQAVSYGELSGRALLLAARLQQHGVGAETRVALLLDRSPELIIALLATLEAGGAYVPIDPNYPEDRIAFMLEDAGVKVLIHQGDLAGKPAETGDVFVLDLDQQAWGEPGLMPRPALTHSDQLAYVIYTSGSTGRPKGTLVTHHNATRLLRATERDFDFATTDVWTLFHSIAFDFSVWEVWGALAYGGRLVIVPYWESRSPAQTLELLARQRVTVLNQTPSAFRQLIAAQESSTPSASSALRYVIFGGEALQLDSLKPWFKRHGDGIDGSGPRLINMYGITETTVHVTFRPVTSRDLGAAWRSPVGRALADLSIHLLDARGRRTPLGAVGELCVGGDGVCRGYLGRPALTAERLVPDASSSRPGTRLYRSGDLARWLPDGDLEYLGRLDHQVKIRGFRIELGEVEAALNALSEVAEGRILVREGRGGHELVAYLVPTPEAAIRFDQEGFDTATLRQAMLLRLPDYMLPTGWVRLDAFPLTVSGKLDHRALPAPDETVSANVEDAPRTATEERVAAIFAEVLELPSLGVHDDFFTLGGHSLLAVSLISRLRAAFGQEIPLRDFFLIPTVAAVAERLAGHEVTTVETRPVPSTEVFVASFAQERLWFLDQMLERRETYNIPWALSLRGPIEISALAAALNELLERHEVLRTVFMAVDGRPLPKLLPPPSTPLPIVDLSALADPVPTSDRLRWEEANRAFDLASSPFRRTLLRLRSEEHHLLLTFHHIACDGWSLGILARDLNDLYSHFSNPSDIALTAPQTLQYADYAAWQRRWLNPTRLEEQLGFWREYLKEAVFSLDLPLDRPRPKVPRERGARIEQRLSSESLGRLESHARKQKTTLFAELCAAFDLLLFRLTGQRNFTFGIVVAGRRRLEFEDLVGFFVNTLLLRGQIDPERTLADHLSLRHREVFDVLAYQDLPFERMVEALLPDRQSNPIQVALALQNQRPSRLLFGKATAEVLPTELDTAKFDLALSCEAMSDGLFLGLDYDRDLFDQTTVTRWLSAFAQATEHLVTASDSRLGQVELLKASERHQLLNEWNDHETVFPENWRVEELFAQIAAATPHTVALCDATNAHCTYSELDRRANGLAHALQGFQIGPERFVGVHAERSIETVIAIFGILKTGSAYLALDPEYPEERLRFMIEDTGTKALISHTDTLPEALDVLPRLLLGEPIKPMDSPPSIQASVRNLIHAIYTSGSTGRPKGVGIDHRCIAALVRDIDYLPTDRDGSYLQLAPLAFDASTYELFGPLLNGARLGIFPNGPVEPSELERVLRNHRLSCLFITAGLFHQMIDLAPDALGAVPRVLSGGEVLSPERARRVLESQRRLLGGGVFINMYGPTETTTFATFDPIDHPNRVQTPMPIGRPIDNQRLYVLDRALRPTAIGVAGELCIGGEGVARGYHRRPSLTADRFLPEINTVEPGARMYRTGDRVRLLADGRVDFIGRIDFQVKIRGFRIEPEEIARTLEEHPALVRALVMVETTPRGDRELVAYAIPEPSTTVAAGDMRTFLAERLPAFMVPAAFVFLDEFPLGPTSKVDRKALVERRRTALAQPSDDENFIAPRSDLEATIASIWQDLLGAPRVGVFTNFFELGGHSLLATQVIARLRAALDVEVPLRTLFDGPTVAELAQVIEGDQEETNETGEAGVSEPVALPRAEDAKIDGWPLSFAQERLWFLDQLLDERSVYNIPRPLSLRGTLDVPALGAAFNALAARHEVLRTVLRAREGEPRQWVQPPSTLAFPVVDLGALDGSDVKAEALTLRSREARQPFDLTQQVWRATLLRLEADEHHLLLDIHHIAADGWSMPILTRELFTLYEAARRNRAPDLPELAIQYVDFAVWQRRYLKGSILDAQLEFWRQRLADAPALVELPTDRPRPLRATHRGATLDHHFPSDVIASLRQLAQESNSTLFVALLSAFQSLISRLAGQPDFSIGLPVAGRDQLATEGLIGFFANTVVLRERIPPSSTFSELLSQVRDDFLTAVAHQDVPFERLVEALQPERSLAHTPLFQVMFAFISGGSNRRELDALSIDDLPLPISTEKFDLTLGCQDLSQDVVCQWSYNRDLFDRTTIERFSHLFDNWLRAVAEHPDQTLASLSWLDAATRHQLLLEWNDTDLEVARTPLGTFPTLLHEPILERSAARPDAIALAFRGPDGGLEHELSYGELERRSGRLAATLQAAGVGPEVPVAIMAERSLELVIALLAIVRSGGFYVPIDPSYPIERQTYMLDTAFGAGPGILLADPKAVAALPKFGRGEVQTIFLDTLDELPERPLVSPGLRPDHLAYMIFTSGSTGRPKGAMNSHRGISSRLHWEFDHYDLDEGRFLQKTPFSFDVSVWEFFVPLWLGARLQIARPDDHRDPARLRHLLIEEGITTVHFVPSMLQIFLDEPELGATPALRRVRCSGEALPFELQQRFFSLLPDVELHNFYGPTETAIEVSWWSCQSGEVVPIGRPLASTQLHVLDRGGYETAIGVAGQLHLGGVQVGRGYFERPRLTAAAFVPDPFATAPGERLYATGDLACWRRDGSVHYLGRIDDQVKVRGLRIELGEIETQLTRLPSVREAIVVARSQGGDTRLVAYAVAERGAVLDEDSMRSALAKTLPEYMVPAAFLILEALPLSPNGKVDRKALPAPEWRSTSSASIAPRGPIEELLAQLWRELLAVDEVGSQDAFFELGGHSLLATRLVARIRSAFAVELPVKTVFETPVLSELATRVEIARAQTLSGADASSIAVEPVPREGDLRLSFSQERLWFLDQLMDASTAYNLPSAVALEGGLDAPAVRMAWRGLVARQESLRMIFPARNGEPRQLIMGTSEPDGMAIAELPLIDLTALEPKAAHMETLHLQEQNAWQPFDLERGPLVRASLVRFAEQRHVLLVTKHHIISDGWSVEVMWRDLSALYRAALAGTEADLPALPLQAADFGAWQRRWLTGEVLDSQLAHWRDELAGAPALLELPTDRPRPAVQGYRGARVRSKLAPELGDELGAVARDAGATFYMLLLASLHHLLAEHAGGVNKDVSIGSPVAGRRHVESEGLIGFFVNTLVLRAAWTGDPPFLTLLERARTAVLEGFAHQELPFEKLVEALEPERSLSYAPLFQVLFVLQNDEQVLPTFPNVTATPLPTGGETTKFDLSFAVSRSAKSFELLLEYDRDLFDPTTMQRYLARWSALLATLVGNLEAPLSSLPLWTAPERHQVIAEWNDLLRPPLPRTLQDFVLDQASQVPDRLALVDPQSGWDDAQLSYGELERCSRQLAFELIAAGVDIESRVGVCASRSNALVIALLGVLRAGGAYVALDPTYPVERLKLIVEDAYLGMARPVLVSEEGHWGSLPDLPIGTTLIGLDEAALQERYGQERYEQERHGAKPPLANLPDRSTPEQLAYVLYTSGSTGRPKGVAISHRSASALLEWARRRYSDEELSGLLAATSINFDLSVFELFVPLGWGGTAILAENALALADHDRFGGAATRVRILNTVPSAAAELLRLEGLPKTVQTINLAGEPLRPALVRELYERSAAARVIDLYGPSEDTTYSTCGPRDMTSPETIGRPIDGTRAYVMSPELRPRPLGVFGELCLAGAGLARGYLSRPAMTAEAFVPEADGSSGRRMYRTGDLARFLPDGRLHFAGRIDHQVKVRGFRIELGEIEIHLAKLDAVNEAVVLVEGREEAVALEAHLVLAQTAQPVTAQDLRDALANTLPNYMVPRTFHVWHEFPRLPNGKIDRKSLVRPSTARQSLSVPSASDAETDHGGSPFEDLVAELFRDLLGVASVNPRDNFFRLGGHSLLATQLISRLNARFAVQLPLRALFEKPTVADLAEAVNASLRSEAEASRPPLVPMEHDGEGPLSFSQERLWFLDRLEPDSAAYNIPMAWRVRVALDPVALEAAWNGLLRRHQVLRARFPNRAGEPVQRIAPMTPHHLLLIDLTALPDASREAEAHRLGRAEGNRPFDLERDTLLRMSLVRCADDDHILLANLHHIAGDGWSVGVWQRDLAALYEAALEGDTPCLPSLPVQYLDFAIWQRSWLRGETLEREIAYWRQALAGAPPLLELPTDRPRPAERSDRGDAVDNRLDADLVARLRARSSEIGATPFMLLLATFKVLLWRYSDQSDVIVGSPIAGRTELASEGLIGFFLNNLVLRTDLARLPGGRSASFAELVEEERAVLLGAYAHQDLPFEKLVEELQPERALSYSPIYQVMLNLHNWDGPTVAAPTLAGTPFEWLGLDEVMSKLDMNVHLEPRPDGSFASSWMYSRDLFDRTTITRLALHFTRLLTAGLDAPTTPLRELAMLTPSEAQQLGSEWNDTARGTLEPACLHQHFTTTATRTPDALALVYGETCLSYGALEIASRALALTLQQRGVGPEERVGLHLERSLEMVIGVLGVLRAGGAYVPLDPALPAARLELMLEDCDARFALAQHHLVDALNDFGDGVLAIEDLVTTSEPTPNAPLQNLATGENLAYVIYTSGTTGRPKGVMCRHRGASAYMRFMLQTFDWRVGDRTLQLASLAFDPSVRELFGPLGAGATIVLLAGSERRDPAVILQRIDEQRITALLSVVPSLLRTLPAAAQVQERSYDALRTVMTNGEKLFIEDCRLARDLFGEALEIVNQYGPTECTMVALFNQVGDASAQTRPVALVGRPVFDKQVHVLDARLERAPIGVVGEACIGDEGAMGDILSRGYLGRPALTAAAFLPDPYSERPGGRLYATGDLVRPLADGHIEFVGRRDHQVKVLGNRVELGEVEAALRRHEKVRSAVVVAWEPEPQETRLVAYIELSEGCGLEQPTPEELRADLRERLPAYMVPSLWMYLDALPLNPNGKVDRKQLPDPSTIEVGHQGAYVAPRTSVERLLAAIWGELLDLQRVSIEDNFFDLGGHSLHGIRSIYRLQELLGIDLKARTLFEAPSIESMAPVVEEKLFDQVEELSTEEAWRLLDGPEPGMGLRDVFHLGDASEESSMREAQSLRRDLALRLARLSDVQRKVRTCRLHQALTRSSAGKAISRRKVRERAPLSWIQEAFWFIEHQEKTHSVYRSNHRVTLQGRPNVPLLKRAVNAVVERHEILRTWFDVDDQGRTFQVIEPELIVELPIVDLQALDLADHEKEIDRVLVVRSSAGFDLRELPLFRLLLLRTLPETSIFLTAMHHIITDNWSMGTIFFQEIAAYFNAYETGEEPRLPELSVQYADYAQWERDLLEGEAMERLMGYWGDKLAGGMPQLRLRTDHPRPEKPSYRGAYGLFALTPELSRALEERSREEDVSLFMTLLAIYNVLLHSWSGQDDILTASPSANRSRIQTENLLGCFANMMLLRTDLSGDPTLREVLQRVKETALGAFSHQEMPFMLLLANFPPENFTFDRSPFQASFTFLNATGGTPQLEGLQVEAWQGVDRGSTDQELALWMQQDDEHLSGTLVYDTDLFTSATIDRIVEDYRRIAEAFADSPDLKLSEAFCTSLIGAGESSS